MDTTLKMETENGIVCQTLLLYLPQDEEVRLISGVHSFEIVLIPNRHKFILNAVIHPLTLVTHTKSSPMLQWVKMLS